MNNFSKEGRQLRPRKGAGSDAARTEKTEFKPRRAYGESHGQGDRRGFGGHKSTSGNKSFGERKPSGERKPFDGQRTYGRPGTEGGERRQRSFDGRHQDGERRTFGDRKPFSGRKPFAPRKNTGFSKVSDEGIERMISRRPAPDFEKSKGDIKVPAFQEEVRLNKFIANSGVCSRREADTLIQAGVVTVNGEVVTELGVKINVLNDDIRFNGQRLKGEEKVYIVMNKPKGFVTTASDPHADRTVLDLMKNCETRVYPVGRLDKNTTGVLMLTNDGEIAERLTHPSYDKKKIYQVILDRELRKEDYETILSGVGLEDGKIAADSLEYIDEGDHRKLGIEIHSGKNRIVRRIFDSLGYDVRALDRVYFAGITKKGLKKGEWRYLSESEVNILKMGAYI